MPAHAIMTGPVGPQGPAGPLAVAYQHSQEVSSDEWVVNHGLGKQGVNVVVRDSAGTNVYGSIIEQSADAVRIQFSAPFSGKAYVS